MQWFTLWTAGGVRIGKIQTTRQALQATLGVPLAFEHEHVTLLGKP